MVSIEYRCLGGQMIHTVGLVEIRNGIEKIFGLDAFLTVNDYDLRSEERRVGKECL